MNTAVCAFLGVSICLVVASIVIGRLLHLKSLKTTRLFSRSSNVLTPFQIFLIGFFLSAVALFVPIYFHDYFSLEGGFIRVLKTILMSVHNTMRLFILDGDFEIVKDAVNVDTVDEVVAKVYTTYFAIVFVVAPMLTAGVVLSFFQNVSSSVKYFCQPKSDIYVMNELNERSLALAKDILTNPTIQGKKVVLFASVFEKEEEERSEFIEEAKRLGAICFKKDVTELKLKPQSKGIKRKLYFIGDDEDTNLRQALVMIARYAESEEYNVPDTQFYVLSNSVESEVLLNSANKGDMRVRRMVSSRNLVIDTLQRRSIFDKAIDLGEEKLVNVVIVGMGGYGEEFFKTICWCGQMQGYKLQIHVFDMMEDIEGRIKSFAPEIIEYNHKKILGEPFYDIYFHNQTDVKSQSFLEEMASIDDITTVYVTLGDDELNIETSMRIRMQLSRKMQKRALLGEEIISPNILAIVYSSIKSETIHQNDGIKDVGGNNFNIEFIGRMEQRYALSFIEQTELENEGLKIHLSWSNSVQERERNTYLYEKYEYNRRSSIAQALHGRYRKQLGLGDGSDITDREDKIMEHNRWNAYMRSEGYVYGVKKDHIAKTHKDLVPFDKLSEATQALDKTINKGVNQ